MFGRLKNGIVLLFLFLLALGASLAYFKPEYAQAALVGIGAFTILFAALVFGKIKVQR